MFWTLSAIAWSHAGVRIGAVAVCAIRITMATLMLFVIHLAVAGTWWPQGVGTRAMVLMSVSGALGAGLGDLLFFRTLRLVGPRVGMMINTAAPSVTALMAALTPLRENLGWVAWGGMALTMCGVGWTVFENPANNAWPATRRQRIEGFAFGLAAIVCYAGGYVLSRMAMGSQTSQGFAPFGATLVRVASGAAMSWLAVLALGWWRQTLRSVGDRRAMTIMLWGTIVGPVIGIWTSLMALDWVPAGVATAMISTGPIFMIPFGYWSHGEKPTWRNVAAALLAVAGVVILVLRPV